MGKKTKNSNSKIRPIILAWVLFIVILLLSLVAEHATHPHVVFGIEDIPYFNAIFGFLSCVAIVLVSKILGVFLKKPENYYGGDDA
ncbi:hypothetical protein N9W34_00670 [Rickettsiales bacterium]|nr:hypothetical protein [Rickettsiales bacterium]